MRHVGSNLGAARDPPESTKGFRMRYEIEKFPESLFCDFENVPISDTCPKDLISESAFGAPEGDFGPPYRATRTLYSGPPAPPRRPSRPGYLYLNFCPGGGRGGFCSAPSLLGLLPPTFSKQAPPFASSVWC